MPRSAWYTLGFATAICLVCSILVTTAAVSLEEKQEINQTLDRRKNVLVAAGLLQEGQAVGASEIEELFKSFEPAVVDLETGEEVPGVDPESVDQRQMAKGLNTSLPVEANRAQVRRISKQAVVYKLLGDDGKLEKLVLPVWGKGLWSTLYGYIALESDLETVGGLTFYEHKETPGLGGEVDNPRWKSLWPGRKIFGPEGEVAIEVIKGSAGLPDQDPYHVDGLSGATITSRGVTYLLRFWLGEPGFGGYLDWVRSGSAQAASFRAEGAPEIERSESERRVV